MSIQLGNVFSTGFDMFGKRLLKLAGLWLVFTVLSYAVSGLALLAIGGDAYTGGALGGLDPDLESLGAAMIFGFGLIYLISFYIYGAQSVSMASMASRLTAGNFGQSFTAGFTGGLTMLGVFILLIIATIVITLPVTMLSAAAGSVSGALGGIFAFLLFILGFYLACRISMIFPVVGVEEERNPITVIVRSWKMTKGNVLPIFLILLIIGAVTMVLFFVIVLIFGVVMAGTMASIGDGFDPSNLGASIGLLGVFLLVFLALAGLFSSLISAIFSAVHSEISTIEDDVIHDTFS